jgi:hypothetical protein
MAIANLQSLIKARDMQLGGSMLNQTQKQPEPIELLFEFMDLSFKQIFSELKEIKDKQKEILELLKEDGKQTI